MQLINRFHNGSGESCTFFFMAYGLTKLATASISSFFVNKFGTSPVLRILFISSRKDS